MRALSLPGCGCRGAFQVAALGRLAEAGETFDLVGGASSGSLTGAVYAAGKVADGPDMFRSLGATPVFSRRWIASERSPFGMSRIVREALERFVPERAIADGPELLVATTRLAAFARGLAGGVVAAARDAVVVHSSRAREDLHDLLLASCTFPPFYARLLRFDGEIHFDGGAADNTLVDALVARGATHVTVITPHASGLVYPGLFRPLGVPSVPPGVELRIVRPARRLRLKSFDFDPARLEEALTTPHEIDVFPAARARSSSQI